MPREGAIIFSDLIGKLDVVRIECAKCGRSGRYRLADLITRYGRDEKLFAFTNDVTANCTRKHARSDSDHGPFHSLGRPRIGGRRLGHRVGSRLLLGVLGRRFTPKLAHVIKPCGGLAAQLASASDRVHTRA